MSIVITLSRQLGSRGSYVAAEVAKTLNLRYLDREVLRQAAKISGYPDEEMIQQLEEKERIPGFLDRIIGAINTMPTIPTIPSATLREGYFYDENIAMMMMQEGLAREEAHHRLIEQGRRAEASKDYGELVQRVIMDYAQKGNVIIVGRGGQIILKNRAKVFHTQIVAPEELRILWLMERLGVDSKEAERQIRQSDKQRVRYMRHFYDAEWLDPRHYHIVVNMGKTSIKLATQIICEAAQQVAQEMPT